MEKSSQVNICIGTKDIDPYPGIVCNGLPFNIALCRLLTGLTFRDKFFRIQGIFKYLPLEESV